jgi:hypothetical protein
VGLVIAAGAVHVITGVVLAAVGWLLPELDWLVLEGTLEHDVRMDAAITNTVRPGRKDKKPFRILLLLQLRQNVSGITLPGSRKVPYPVETVLFEI